jgi:hypothetical protein
MSSSGALFLPAWLCYSREPIPGQQPLPIPVAWMTGEWTHMAFACMARRLPMRSPSWWRSMPVMMRVGPVGEYFAELCVGGREVFAHLDPRVDAHAMALAERQAGVIFPCVTSAQKIGGTLQSQLPLVVTRRCAVMHPLHRGENTAAVPTAHTRRTIARQPRSEFCGRWSTTPCTSVALCCSLRSLDLSGKSS